MERRLSTNKMISPTSIYLRYGSNSVPASHRSFCKGEYCHPTGKCTFGNGVQAMNLLAGVELLTLYAYWRWTKLKSMEERIHLPNDWAHTRCYRDSKLILERNSYSFVHLPLFVFVHPLWSSVRQSLFFTKSQLNWGETISHTDSLSATIAYLKPKS